MPAKGFTLIEGDPLNLEKFYQAWTVPVRAWTASYVVQLVYAFVMVYTMMKACLSEESKPGLFERMIPTKCMKQGQ